MANRMSFEACGAGGYPNARPPYATPQTADIAAPGPSSRPGRLDEGLCQALGAVGKFSDAEGFAAALTDAQARARHLATLSLCCSLGNHGYAPASSCASVGCSTVRPEAPPPCRSPTSYRIPPWDSDPLAPDAER